MAILNIFPLQTGASGIEPSLLYILTNDTSDTVTTAGYLTASKQFGYTFSAYQMALVYTTDDNAGWYGVSVDVDGNVSLIPEVNPGSITLPVFSGDFAVFDGTEGVLKDAGYSASNAAKTKVVMANGAVVSGNVPTYSDTSGTIGDGGLATNKLLTSAIATPDVSIDLVRFDASVTTAALASGGVVTLFTSASTKQYKVVALWLNFAANLTTGNRNLTISDGTTTYSVIPSASLLLLVNATWGSTALPFPATVPLNTSLAVAQNLRAAYSGGTTDYDTGSTFIISGILQRVA